MTQARGYKRSWRNLLINKKYQLRFTLFMVGLSAVLMAGLGWWVMRVASEATDVATNAITPCPEPPKVLATPTAPEAPPSSDSGTTRHVAVDVHDAIPPEFAQQFTASWTCAIEHAGRVEALKAGRLHILEVLLATGAMLIIVLAIYGIKTTHKVAGPLYKVQLYFGKMKDGRYDKVWPLRKGDQLVAFYDHFRQAHAGVVKMEEDDVERLRAVLDAADAGGLAGKSPEVDAALAELREMLARKEKALA